MSQTPQTPQEKAEEAAKKVEAEKKVKAEKEAELKAEKLAEEKATKLAEEKVKELEAQLENQRKENERLKKSSEVKKDEKPVEKKKKREVVVGSVDSKYEVPEGEEGLVHFVLEDYASPRSKDMTKVHKPQTRTVKSTPRMFVMQFADNFNAGDAFRDVATPGQIVSMMMNVTKAHIADAFMEQIISATKGNARQKATWVNNKLDKMKRLNLVGGNQIIPTDGILHIPNVDGYPFDAEELKKFPQECIHDGEDY
jgi:hypothetical protein